MFTPPALPIWPLTLARVLGVILLLSCMGSVSAHNLDMRINYLIFDKETHQMIQSRAAAGQPLMRAGDTVGVILKATPNQGTKTGAGGYSTFFVPVGTQIVGAEYGAIQDGGDFRPQPMKGQSILTHGRDPVDPGAPNELRGYVIGPNILGVSSQMAENTSAGFCWGTLAGLYGDTGIFYSTDPATAWQSWTASGGLDGNPATNDTVLRNNKGDFITPTTMWDAHQLIAFGIKSPGSPILDRNGRGSTPWGVGTPVAGPESGYAWSFNKTYWDSNPSNPNRMRNSIQVGPWKRLRYPGSEVAKDTPGRRSSALDLVGVDGSQFGIEVTPANPLPPTVSWTDTTSPKALRLSWGGLELYRPEYCRIFVKILKNPGEPGAPFDPQGYLQLFGETFGGDAGGEYGNKDHVWRYYKPNVIGLSSSPMIEVTSSKRVVLPNEIFHFDIRVTNLGNTPLTNAIIENVLPAGLSLVSAMPVQNAGPNPIRWNIGTLAAQSTRSLRINVRATVTGLLTNRATIRSDQDPTPKEASDMVTSDFIAIMYGDKSVTPEVAGPGDKVIYRIVVSNEGACPNRSPWRLREFLPEGFKFTRVVDRFLNGSRASSTVIAAVTTDLNRPEFHITRALDQGKTMEILFEAELSPSQKPGRYLNRYAIDYDDKVYVTGLIAPVTVGGAVIGDLVYQDWNGNGTHDAGEPGLPNVSLQLWTDPNGDGDPADGVLRRTVTSNGQGIYSFGGSSPGNYVVQVSGGVPAGYQLTGDPEGPLNGRARLTIADNNDQLWVDFGYRPQGNLSVSGLVYSDLVNDGVYQPDTDTPINNVSLSIFFDRNNNGIVDGGDIPVATTTTSTGGVYTFNNLAPALNYVVQVNATSPALASFFQPNSFTHSSPSNVEILSLQSNTTEINFGFFADLPGSIGDQVFQDLNRNGVFDTGDIPVPGVTVRLFHDVNNNKTPDAGEFVREMPTNSQGRYHFTELGEGDYVVSIDVADPNLPTGTTIQPPHRAVTVLPAEDRMDIDFPLSRVLSLAVSPAGTALPGDRLNYSLSANYPLLAQFGAVTISNPIPAGTTLVPGSASGGGSQAGNVLTWNVGSTSPPVQHTYTPLINCVRNIRIEESTTIQDTYINAASASTVYNNGTLRLRPSSSSQRRHAMIRFNMGEVPPGATIRSVSVGFRVSSTRTNQTASLFPMTTPWVRNVTSWNDPNGSSPGRWASGSTFSALDYDTTRPLGSFATNTLGYKVVSNNGLRDLVQSWIDNPASNQGIALIATGSDAGESRIFDSKSTANNVPYMDIQFEYTAQDACLVDSHGSAYWSRNGLLNGQWAKWNGGNFEETQTAPPLTANFEFVVGASSAQRDEKIVAGIMNMSGNNVAGQMWDGSSWSNLPMNPLGRANSISDVGVAVAYEQASGRAMLVWNDANRPAGQMLRFSIWNGTSWTTPASITSYTGAEPANMKITVKPDGNEMVLVINDWNYSDHVIVWNGTSWNNSLLLETGVANPANIHDIAVAYESLTGRAMVLYGRNSQRHVYYRIWNGSSWTNQLTLNGPSNLSTTRYLTTSSDPGGNQIAVGVVATGRDAWFSIWNGSSWSTPFVAEYDLNTEDAPTVACAFEGQSGRLLVAYSELNHNGVKFRTWSQSAGWSAEATTIPLNGEANSVILQPDINTNQVMLAAQDDTQAVVVTRWMGDRWKGFRELEDNTGKTNKQPFTYLWDIYRRNPNPPETTTQGLVGPASIINHNQVVNVSITLTSSRNVENIVPPDPTHHLLTGSGATATKLSGPSPGATIVGQRGTTYTWTYRINGGASPAECRFSWPQFTIGEATFAAADSNSYLYVPTFTYQLDINTPAGTANIRNQASINLGSGPVSSNIVDTPLVESIGDTVWADYNLDGVQADDEPGLPGVRVFIDSNNNGLLDDGESFSITDPNGHYQIVGVTPSTVRVAVDVTTTPADFIASTSTQLTRLVAAGQSYFDCDFGFAPRPLPVASATISGLVWNDADEDGLPGDYEAPLPNVPVRLHMDANDNGLLDSDDFIVATSTTDTEGSFTFTDLLAGNYLVTSDSSALPGMVLVSGHSPLNGAIPITLTPAEENTVSRFGYNYTGSIGGFVFYDFNGNGIHDPNGEDGLPGTEDDEIGVNDGTIQLIVDENNNGEADPQEPVFAFAQTDPNGLYLFTQLPPGNYIAKVEDQGIEAPANSDNAGQVGFMLATTEEQIPIALSPGQAFAGADYGFIEKAILRGYVYHDEDSSTLRDPAEPGLPNITVTLMGVDFKGQSVNLTTDTNIGGQYLLFVPPGDYTLTYNTTDPDLPPGLIRATTPTAYQVSVVPGVERSDFDFGRDHDGILAGRVFNDDNADGTQNRGEDGIPFITVQLYNASGTTLITTTTTDHFGNYRFTGLPDGTFTLAVLHESLPPGYGTIPTADPDAVKDGRSTPTIAGGIPVLNQHFGYRHDSNTHILSGLLFDDSGAGGGVYSNGIRDGAEPGMAGVNLRMEIDFDKNGTVDEFRTLTTEANGAFISNGVPSGAAVELYIVERSLPRRAYAPTADPNGAVDGRAIFTAVTDDLPNLIFGFSLQPSTISGTVVLGDGNGIADPGETPMANVIIRLFYAGDDDILGTTDDQVFTRFTNASGQYTVANLDPGVFQITQAVPFGFKARADADGGVPTNISLTVSPGGQVPQQDFENYELPQIRGRVLVDNDRDGLFSPGDGGVPNVTVRLFQDVNANGIKDPGDTQVMSVMTDATGLYRFGPINDPASFFVEHDLPATMISLADADGPANTTNRIAVSVVETDIPDQHFLNRPIPMTLGGAVFNDHNSNALRGPGENGLAGINVRLIDTATNQEVGTATTAADGRYSFPGLWPGNYLIRLNPPASHPASGGTPVALDNDQINDNNGLQPGGPGTEISSPIIAMQVNTESILDGDTDPNTNLTVDVGLFTGITLGNLVWTDTNNNGIRNGFEAGIANLQLQLFSPGSDNAVGGEGDAADTLVATTTTNSSGLYSFRVFQPGNYYVRIQPPASRPLASAVAVNLDNGVDDDSNAIQLGLAGSPIVSPIIQLTAGGEPGSTGNTNAENTIDFGLRACPIVTPWPASLPASAVYAPYSQVFTAAGGIAPHTWSVVLGSLPGGLTLDPNGTLAGSMLTAPGDYNFTVEARDALGCIGTRAYTISVTCPNPTITPADANLPTAWHWQNYNQTFVAEGVAAAYTWTRVSGSFPIGLSLNSNTGVLSGNISGAPGIYTFTIRATDPMGFCLTNKEYTLEVRALWDHGDLPDTLAGTSFSGGAMADYRTRVSDNGPRHSIRPGFRLGSLIDHEDDAHQSLNADGDNLNGTNDEDGLTFPSQIIAGTPSTATISVTNTTGATARGNLWIDWNGNGNFEDSGERVVNNSTITNSRSYTINVPIGAVLNRPLGVRVRLTSASLSSSLGTANDGEVEDYTVTVVCPTITIANPSLPTYYLGAPMSQTFTASGGTSPYTWSVASGALPAGLSLSPSGTLSGTPSAHGTFNVTLQAADAYGCVTTRPITLVVKGLSIGNLVFDDTDDNGFRSAWEPGVPGVTLQLFSPGADNAIGGTGPNSDSLIATTVSGPDGSYRFDHIPVGNVFVRLTPPPHLRVVGGTPVTVDNGIDNDNNGSQPGGPGTPLFSPIIALTPGLEPINDGDGDPDTDLTIDFGIWSGVGIGSTIFNDANSNGRLDADENGIANVRVELWRDEDGDEATGGNVFVAHTTSNASGHYTFLGYPTGRYQIVIPSSNFAPGQPLHSAPFSSPVRAYADDQVDNDSNAIQAFGAATEARSPLIDLAPGDEPIGSGLGGITGEFGRGGELDDSFPDENADMTVDMGFVAPGSIGLGNLIFVDENDNGVADPGEGVNSVVVQLFAAGDNPLTDPPLLSTTTTNGGRYLFSIVWEGSFFIYLPAYQFGDTGVLRATFPIPGTTPGDDDVGEKSLSTTEPWITGVRSLDFALAYGTAPTAATGETGTDSASDDAADADSDLTIDIGLFRPVGLGNMVFFDQNESGTADLGEGIDGVKVEIYSANQVPGFDTPIDTQITSNGGFYMSTMLKRGSYRAHIPASEFAPNKPLHLAASINDGLSGDDDVGEDGINAANPALTGVTTRFISLFPGSCPTAGSGETGLGADLDDHLDAAIDLTIDFGFQQPVGLGNLVFIDSNENGVFDIGEGVGGVRVELYREDQNPGLAVPIFVQTTRADGHYFFDKLGTGSYKVHIPANQFQPGAPLAGVEPLPFNPEGDDDQGQNGMPSENPAASGITSNIVALAIDSSPINSTSETGFNHTADDFDDNNFDLTIDFGFSAPDNSFVGVGNLVFIDTNGNQRYDTGEGAANVVVQLFEAGSNPQLTPPFATTTTNEMGLYLFTGLAEGNYFIHIPASQFQFGYPLYNLLSLPGHGEDNGLDDDLDENGIDSANPPATGISSVVFNLSLGQEPTGEFGEGNFMDNFADANHDLTFDFGFFSSMGLGNLVFIDANGNGRADPAEGVAGVMVELYTAGSLPGWNAPFATTMTDTEGRYLFSNLIPGDYIVHIPYTEFQPGATLANLVTLANTSPGDDDSGQDGLPESNPQWYGVSTTIVSLVSGAAPVGSMESGLFGSDDDANDANIDLTIDLGFAPALGLGNLVFADLNDDGIFDPVLEFGIDNVVVELWSDGEEELLVTTTTTADGGLYRFNVPAGSYYVKIPASEFEIGSPLAYYRSSKDSFTGTPSTAGDDDVGEDGLDTADARLDGIRTAVFSIAANSAPTAATGETGHLAFDDDDNDANTDLTIDLGFAPKPLSVGNLVFRDLNEDGRFSTGDQPIAGVPLQLFRVGDNPQFDTPLAITLSSANGSYLLQTFAEGDYYIHIPASAFAIGGPLAGATSVPGFGSDDGTDDDANEDGIDSPNPDLTGINSIAFQLAYGAEPISPNEAGNLGGTETGAFNSSDDADDDLTDLTIDFGFIGGATNNLVAIGNLVFIDANNNGSFDEGEGVDNVWMLLYPAGVNPGSPNPLATTFTTNGGRYLFGHLPAGEYVVHVAADNFKAILPTTGSAGPLHTFVSRPGSGSTASTDDDDSDENGLDHSNPELAGISSHIISIAPGQAPVVTGSETGAYPEMNQLHGDANVDLTVDFAFVAPAPGSPASERVRNTLAGTSDSQTDSAAEDEATDTLAPATYQAWAQLHALGTHAAPELDADQDGLSNLLEYALGSDPLNGFHHRPALQFYQDPTTGLLEARTTRPASGLEDLRIIVQTRNDLSATAPDWLPLTSTPTTLINADGTQTLRYTDLAPLTAANLGFIRLLVQLDSDGDGSAEATSASPIAAFIRRDFHTGQQTVSHPLLNRTLYSGPAQVSGLQQLNLTLTSGQDLSTLFTTANHYYVEVCSGPATGHRFEIDRAASQGSTLMLNLNAAANTTAELPTGLDGARIEIRAHHHLGSLLPAAALTAATDSATADRALFFSRTGNQFEIHWAKAADTTAHWQSSTGSSDLRHIAPGEAFLLHLRQMPRSTVWTGWVRQNDFRLALQPGSQLIGPGFPVAHSTATFGFAPPHSIPAALPAQADRIRTWLGDSQPNTTGYRFLFLLDSASPEPTTRWVDQNDASQLDLTTQPLFPTGSGFFYHRASSSPALNLRQSSPAP
jgi:uncharacterized repeat protein (TIGR01451 family)